MPSSNPSTNPSSNRPTNRSTDRSAKPTPNGTTLSQKLLRRKPVTVMEAETGSETGKSELSRSIGLFQLSAFGIGATIGTGIFFVLSEAVPLAGPAVIWSFVIAGVVAGLTAVCYAELAGAVPGTPHRSPGRRSRSPAWSPG